jgi:hypothetical protein
MSTTSLDSILGFSILGNNQSDDSLCPYCKDLNGTLLEGHEVVLTVNFGPSKLKACRNCRILLDAIACVPSQWMLGLVNATVKFSYNFTHGLSLTITEPDNTGRTVSIYLYCEEVYWKCFLKPSNVGLREEEKLDKIALWALQRIDKCLDLHSRCQPGFPHRKPPTRVIDLRITQKQQGNDVRLYEPDGEICDYVCLSHCWGGTQPLRTLKGNFEDHKRGIKFSAMPKTFQDAVVMTRQLGIPWIWIDSLCIVQDNPEDWRREAAKMAEVYGWCRLCIASTGGSGADSGLFHEPMPNMQMGFLDDEGNERHLRICFAKRCQRWLLEDQNTRMYSVTTRREAPLLTRAWVLQERLLSPRILHFLKQDIIFECSTGTYCECSHSIRLRPEQNPKLSHGEAIHASTARELDKRWQQMVTTYMSYQITYAKDRLPAIAGLAGQMRMYRPDDYFKGIWTQTAVHDLMWRSSRTHPFPSDRNAPSWSWASIDGQIEFVEVNEDAEEITCKVAFPQLEEGGENEMGIGTIMLLGNIACLADCHQINFAATVRTDYDTYYARNDVFLMELARSKDKNRIRGIAMQRISRPAGPCLKQLFNAVFQSHDSQLFRRIGQFQIWQHSGTLEAFFTACEHALVQVE